MSKTVKTKTAVEHDAGGDAAMARAAKKLPVPKPTAKQQALSAAREETGKRVKKTGRPSSDAKTPVERAATVKQMLSEQKGETKSEPAPTSDPSDPGDIPEFLRRKPGEKLQAPASAPKTNGAAPTTPYVDPREQHQRDLREAQKQADAEKAAAKRASKKKASAPSSVDKTAMPLTGKAALRAINEAAIAKSNVEPTKVPEGVLREFRDEEAAAEAERANKVLRIMPRKPNEGERKLYDWKGAREAAADGKIPSPPDFSANTHRVYRPALAAVVQLVNAKDLEGLQKHRVEGSCSSPKAIKRYREIALIALKAKLAR